MESITSRSNTPVDWIDTSPEDRFCDLVMKGGITSGIVYPLAIVDLCKHYRFHSIGGTSAGAIAAAATAAAEYRRRAGCMKGFQRLAGLPQELCETVKGPVGHVLGWFLPERQDCSRLLSLFQPQPGCHRNSSRVLLHSLNRETSLGRAGAIAGGFLRTYWPVPLFVVAGVAAHSSSGQLLADIAVAILVLLCGMAIWAYVCPRRLNFDPPCRLNIDPGTGAAVGMSGCVISVGGLALIVFLLVHDRGPFGCASGFRCRRSPSLLPSRRASSGRVNGSGNALRKSQHARIDRVERVRID